MKKLITLAILLIAEAFLISCAGAQPASTPVPGPSRIPAAATETLVTDVAKLFTTNCAVCHGERRQGVSGLAPALTATSLTKLSDAETRDAILKGRPNTAMAGFERRLNSEEIDALVQLIKRTSP